MIELRCCILGTSLSVTQFEKRSGMQRMGVFLGFVPWVVFSVVSRPSTWEWAALAALVCSLILVVPGWRQTRSMSILDATGLVFFAVMAVLALVLDHAVLQPLEDRAQLLSSVVIALVAFGSLAAGRPFTEYYARQTTPREYWERAVPACQPRAHRGVGRRVRVQRAVRRRRRLPGSRLGRLRLGAAGRRSGCGPDSPRPDSRPCPARAARGLAADQE